MTLAMPFNARLAHVRHLAGQLPKLLRTTAPPAKVCGRYEAGSMVQVFADKADAGSKGEVVKEAARDAQQSAQRQPWEAA